MKRNCILKFLSIICVLSFVFSSCNSGIDLSDIDDPTIKIDESLVLPLGEANLTLKDVIEKIGLPTGVDTIANEIYFQWAFYDEFSFEKFSLADSIRPFNKTYRPVDYAPSLVGIPLPPYLSIPPILINDTFDLGVNGNVTEHRIDSMKVNSSLLEINFDVSDDLKHIPASDFTIQFIFDESSLKVDGGIVPTYKPNQYNVIGNIPIGKYAIYTKGLSTLPYTIQIKINPTVPIIFTPSSYINIYIKFAEIDFEAAYGFFNTTTVEKKSIKIPFNIEDYLPVASLKFANPMVQIIATTNVGTNLNFKIDYISAYNESNPTNKIWAWFDEHTTNSKEEQIVGPTELGEWTTKIFDEFDSENGETDQLFDNKPFPNIVDYRFSISSDPARIINYITPDSKIKFDLKVKIPLKLKGGSTYSFSDTINLPNVGNTLNNVDSAILVLKLKNGLPLKANYRMTFWKSYLDNDTIPAIGGFVSKVSDDNTLGNMTSEFVVNSPEVDSAGTVNKDKIVPQTIKIMLNKAQIAALKQTSFIVFHVLLDSEKTTVGGVETRNPIHITTDNSFGVKLGVIVKGSVTANLGTSN